MTLPSKRDVSALRSSLRLCDQLVPCARVCVLPYCSRYGICGMGRSADLEALVPPAVPGQAGSAGGPNRGLVSWDCPRLGIHSIPRVTEGTLMELDRVSERRMAAYESMTRNLRRHRVILHVATVAYTGFAIWLATVDAVALLPLVGGYVGLGMAYGEGGRSKVRAEALLDRAKDGAQVAGRG